MTEQRAREVLVAELEFAGFEDASGYSQRDYAALRAMLAYGAEREAAGRKAGIEEAEGAARSYGTNTANMIAHAISALKGE